MSRVTAVFLGGGCDVINLQQYISKPCRSRYVIMLRWGSAFPLESICLCLGIELPSGQIRLVTLSEKLGLGENM